MSGKAPGFNIVVFEDGADGKTYSTIVGAAWTTKDGKGVTARVRPGLALTGSFAILKRKPPEEQQP